MSLERITITIKQETLQEIDNMIDGKDIRNRSHAIENLLIQSLGKLDTVLILAGGTKKNETPKAMIKIHEKTVLEHQINMLKKYGINNIVLAIDRKEIIDYFGSGEKFNVKIEYIVEEKSQGNVWPLHSMKNKSTFAVMNVDTLMNPDIHEMFEFHKKNKSLATMMLVTTENTSKLGVAIMRGNKITDFVEKPPSAESKLVNGGFYIVSPAILSLLTKKGSIENTAFPKLAKENLLLGYVHDSLVFDVAKDYNKAAKQAAKRWRRILPTWRKSSRL